jgi:hypothetical protein
MHGLAYRKYNVVLFHRFRFRFMVFNATFNNISVIWWWSVLLVEESIVPRENHWPVVSHWQTLSHNVVSSTPRYEKKTNKGYTGKLRIDLKEDIDTGCDMAVRSLLHIRIIKTQRSRSTHSISVFKELTVAILSYPQDYFVLQELGIDNLLVYVVTSHFSSQLPFHQ